MTAPTSRDVAFEFGGDHRAETSSQVTSAVLNLMRPDSDWLEWPFPDLTALCGRIAPRNVWYVCAFSGNGKTLFVTSAIRAWVAARVKVYVLPLETAADDFRTYLACQSVGIDPGVVSGGGLLDMPFEVRTAWEAKIQNELLRQEGDRELWDHLKIKGVDAIDLPRLARAAEEAADWGARALIADHIDQIEGGDGSKQYAESVRVNKAAHKIARKYDMPLLFTSQMNTEAIRGGRDRLAQFGPPMPHHVFMGGHKRQIATGMIGLHRRLRDPHDGETKDEYHAALKQSRDGDVPPLEALQPGVMAVTAMKLRNFGSREGQRCFLGVANGQVSPLPEKDRYSTTFEGRKRI